MLDHGYYHSSLFPTVSKPVLLGCKYTVKQRRDVSKHLHFSNQIAKLSSSSVPAQSNLNWDLNFNQEFPVRFGCCKRQSWSARWVDQQYFDGTTWPCLTHALRPTHSLRFASLVLWKCGILGVLLSEARSDRLAQELGRPVWIETCIIIRSFQSDLDAVKGKVGLLDE